MFRIFLIALVATAIPLSAGSAQIPLDPNCPPTAWCHPDGEGLGQPTGFMDGMTQAADAVGKALQDYECKGGYDCLGVALRDLMCAIDGREIAQMACGGGGGDGGGGAGDGGGAEPKPDDPGGTPPVGEPTPPASTPPTPQAGTLALELHGFQASRLQNQLARTRVGSQLRLGTGDGTRFTLQAKYADRASRPNRFIAVIQVSPNGGGQPTQMAVLVDGGKTRVVHHSVFRSTRRR